MKYALSSLNPSSKDLLSSRIDSMMWNMNDWRMLLDGNEPTIELLELQGLTSLIQSVV